MADDAQPAFRVQFNQMLDAADRAKVEFWVNVRDQGWVFRIDYPTQQEAVLDTLIQFCEAEAQQTGDWDPVIPTIEVLRAFARHYGDNDGFAAMSADIERAANQHGVPVPLGQRVPKMRRGCAAPAILFAIGATAALVTATHYIIH